MNVGFGVHPSLGEIRFIRSMNVGFGVHPSLGRGLVGQEQAREEAAAHLPAGVALSITTYYYSILSSYIIVYHIT